MLLKMWQAMSSLSASEKNCSIRRFSVNEAFRAERVKTPSTDRLSLLTDHCRAHSITANRSRGNLRPRSALFDSGYLPEYRLHFLRGFV
jgi:hypothetical protein